MKLLPATLLLALFLSHGAFAAFSVQTENPTPQLRQFLFEIQQSLPHQLKNIIAEPVTIKFEALDENKKIEVRCLKDKPIGADQEVRQILGKLKKKFLGVGASRPYTIYLHSNFLPIIEAGEDSAKKYPCGHGNLYRLALASAIHEISHIYDFSDKLLSYEDQTTLQSCDNRGEGSSGVASSRCGVLASMSGKVSDRMHYKSLTGFMGWGSGNKNRNLLQSPDPYEFSDANEHFAVNMEYFLLDKDYACRRPALYQYFSQVFDGYRPFHESSCSAVKHVIGSGTGLPVSMDPERAYAVHYLYATKGTAMMSRWGHAMLRVIMCAPERKEVGPDCMKDIAHHVVISFRANIEGHEISNWDGLIGKYPSQLMIVSMGEVVEEYTRKELRNLVSLPIELTRPQMELLIRRAAEQFWGYAGKYYFLSNNCASESDQLIKGVLPEYHPYQEAQALSPVGVYDNLVYSKLMNERHIRDKEKAHKEGYYFPSQREALEAAFALVKIVSDGEYSDVDEFLNESTAAIRRELFDKAIQKDKRAAAGFYLLEKAVQRRSDGSLQSHAIKAILEFENTGKLASATREMVTLLQGITKSRSDLQPWNLISAKESYGVPVSAELIANERYSELLKSYFGMITRLRALIDGLFQEQAAEQKRSQENLRHFLEKMRG